MNFLKNIICSSAMQPVRYILYDNNLAGLHVNHPASIAGLFSVHFFTIIISSSISLSVAVCDKIIIFSD